MTFNVSAALLDAVVLAVVSREESGTYGYKITQEVKDAMELSESTLYPVLRRLQKEGYLEIYDQAFSGRNRRYYKATASGMERLCMFRMEWAEYTGRINRIMEGGEVNE